MRRQRLRDALGAFDGATIATTHQFCHLVLRSLGVAGDTDAERDPGRGPRGPAGRGRRRPLPPRFGNLEGVPPFTHAEALKLARAAVSDPQARLSPAPTRSTSTPSAVSAWRSRRRRARGARPAQATARCAQLRRPALAAGRRPGRRGRARPGAHAPALEGRAGRRVPGHRPGAVAGPRPGVLRPRHDGADRRPEAGDLRLPRRRRHDVPPGRRHRHHPQDPRHQPAQRRGPARLAADGAARTPPSARTRSSSAT